MGSEAITQEHEMTVSAARINMTFHDEKSALARWFSNYKDDRGATFWGSGWVTVTRDGRRWRVEFGEHDCDTPFTTKYADPGAPQPPIFEFRAPKPEPVKPRFNNPEPRRVPAWDRGGFSYTAVAEMQRMAGGRLQIRAMAHYLEPLYRTYFDRMAFERYTAPPPPPPTRRNQ